MNRIVMILLGIFAVSIIFVNCKKKSDDTTPPVVPNDSTVKDFDGNIYHKVKLGTQVWLAENLKATHYRNGDPVAHTKDMPLRPNFDSTGAFYIYNNDPAIAAVYGLLYNWFAISDTRHITPVGWHIATDAEWTALEVYLGGSDVAGGKLKEKGTAHWVSPNIGATNETGFGALPSGNWDSYSGNFTSLGQDACFWSSTKSGTYYAYARAINTNYSRITRGEVYRGVGYSLRCVQD